MTDVFREILLTITKWQHKLNGIISSNFREIKDETSLSAILVILGISFIYGVIHAIGPGHGKALVASYFISKDHDYKKAFKIGYMVSMVHAASALTITLVIYYILNVIFSKTFQETSVYTTKFSAVLIIGIGIYLFFEHHSEDKKEAVNDKSDFALAVGAGIVPCPGVMTVVLFSIMMGKIMIGIIAAILMSIGMGLTISLSAILATGARKAAPSKLTKYFPYFGHTMIILLGLYLLLA